jgi:hypothetical protein
MMNKILKTLLITGPLFTGVLLWSSLDAAQAAEGDAASQRGS